MSVKEGFKAYRFSSSRRMKFEAIGSEPISLRAVEFDVPAAGKRYTAAVIATAPRVPQRF